MRISLATRLKKLEMSRAKQGPNRIVVYTPGKDGAKNAALRDSRPGRWMLVPNFGTAAAWEAALDAQQRRLMNQAERRD